MDISNETDWLKMINMVKESDLPDVDKVAQVFGWILSRTIEHGEREVELAKAMQDRETLIKEQIKLGVIKYAREIFNDCGRHVLGRRFWDE
jgi:predicted transcriptional regulator